MRSKNSVNELCHHAVAALSSFRNAEKPLIASLGAALPHSSAMWVPASYMQEMSHQVKALGSPHSSAMWVPASDMQEMPHQVKALGAGRKGVVLQRGGPEVCVHHMAGLPVQCSHPGSKLRSVGERC